MDVAGATWTRASDSGRTVVGGVAALVALAALAGCATGDARTVAEPVPHGRVAGAEETAEARLRLVLADAAAGDVHLLDLITGETTRIATGVTDVGRIRTDGRRAYLTTRDGKATRVIDGGAWTVDHGDHVHHYRTTPRDLGTTPGTGHLLDRARLDEGELRPLGDGVAVRGGAAVRDGVPVRDRVAVPYRDRLLVPGDGLVRVWEPGGAPAGVIAEPCPDQEGEALTPRGAVFGCADGVLLVTGTARGLDGVKIPYPDEGLRVRRFGHRPGGTVLAAPAERRTGHQSAGAGVWALDVTRRSWTRLRTGPVTAVTAAGDGAPVLALSPDGALRSFDHRSGRELGRTDLLEETSGAVIEVDTGRAYVNDPAGRAVHEIDYRDGLRRARTFRLGFTPGHMVETGR
ncbi:hypothetical protein JYK22_36190 [Nonomuraea sp. RK-328]|nr:hypothetical protein [Nonomuraea sp. RK-328]